MAKLIHSNGKKLSVYDISDEPIMTLNMRDYPLKMNGYHILEDEAAREKLKELIRTGLYDKN